MTDFNIQEFTLPPRLRHADSVMLQLIQVAHRQCGQSFTLIQESIYHVSEKAAQGRTLCEEEVSFIRQLFELPWWAGVEYGANEARRSPSAGTLPDTRLRGDSPVSDPSQVFLAELLHHYLHGQGALYPLRRPVYLASVIVKDTVNALKSYIRELYTKNQPATLISSCDRGFLQSMHAVQVEKKRQHVSSLGFIFNDGTMVLEQKDPRSCNIANRFRITAMTSTLGNHLMTRWRVEGTYRFESFDSHALWMELPVTPLFALKIPSGLANHLSLLGLAHPFDYFTDWAERYRLSEY